MVDFLAVKINETIHIGITMDIVQLLDTGDGFCPSNMPFRIIETEFGKVLIASACSSIVNQIVLSRTDLFPKKKKHIDYDFLSSTYLPSIGKIIDEEPLKGKDGQSYDILIVSGGKIYDASSSLLYEDNMSSSYKKLIGSCLALKDNLSNIDGRSLILESFKMYSLHEKEPIYPLVYINTETFVPEIVEGDHI